MSPDKKILLPRAKIASAELPATLRAKAACVDDIPLYETLTVANENRDEIAAQLLNRELDIVTFTSSSTVTNFLEMFPAEALANVLVTGCIMSF